MKNLERIQTLNGIVPLKIAIEAARIDISEARAEGYRQGGVDILTSLRDEIGSHTFGASSGALLDAKMEAIETVLAIIRQRLEEMERGK